MPKVTICAAVLVALTMAADVRADVQCRMPNGKTINLQTATQCPPDAAQVDGAGRVLRPARAAATPAVRKPPAPAAPAVVGQPARSEPSAFDAATTTCAALRNTSTVSECRVNSNILSASTLDVTVTSGLMGPKAWADCVLVAEKVRALAPRAFRASDWQLRYFSPFSGDRPIATCRL